MNSFVQWIESTGLWAPWAFVGLFAGASTLMVWRLEKMSQNGFEGTVLGTLVMPYCSGIGNLLFAFMIGMRNGPGQEVVTNALVNNVTNLTLLIALPTVIWGMSVGPVTKGKSSKGGAGAQVKLNRLSLLLTLTAVLFFSGAAWTVAGDGTIDQRDGLVLIGLFLFWQAFHVFEVLKSNVRQNRTLGWWLGVDLVLLGVGTLGVYISTDWLVTWISASQTGFISAKNLGWLTGWLMVLPNALLAFYYARRGNPEVVYASQVGDGHLCIPLCIGITALYHPIRVPAFMPAGIAILLCIAGVHFLSVALLGKLPKWLGWILLMAYLVFVAKGLPA